MISFKAEVENSPGNAKQLLETQKNEKIYVTLASRENSHSLPNHLGKNVRCSDLTKVRRGKLSMFMEYFLHMVFLTHKEIRFSGLCK